ncbi:MAG TPA: polysaccharide biosynthesis C-terminal domain-containing protein [Candidatus Eremiobacteraceae bacterium]
MRERSSLGRDSIRTLAFSIGQSGFAVLTGIAIAKALGPTGKGEYASLQLLQAAAAGVTGNLGMAITYELTRQQKKLSDLVKPLSLMLAALSVIEWAAIGVWVWLKGPDPAPLLFAAAVPALILLSWQGPIFLGLGWIKSLNVQSLYFAAGTFAAAVITLYVFRLGTVPAMWGWVVCVWAIAISILVRTHRESRGTQTDSTGSIMRGLLSFGLRASAGGIFGFINNKIDSVAILTWLGTAGFGVYSVAVAAGEVLFKVSRSVAQAATQRVAAAERDVAARTVAKSNRASFAIIVVVSTVAFIAAPLAVDVLFGVSFHRAGDAIRILLPGIAAMSCSGILSTFFNFQLGRPIFLLYMSIMNAVVETTLCLILVPRFQINGAALASTLTYLNSAAVMTWYFCKNSDLSPVDLWIPTLADVRTVLRAIRPTPMGLDDLNTNAGSSGSPSVARGTLAAADARSRDFVICGWTDPSERQRLIGSLVLGVFDRGHLIYAGHAEPRYDNGSVAALYEKLVPLEFARCPFRIAPTSNSPVHWLIPTLVAEVTFGEAAGKGALPEPIYVGLSVHKRPEECVSTQRPE